MMKTIFRFLSFIIPILSYSQQQFVVYDTTNSQIPDNIIKTVTVDSLGTVWFVTGDCFSGGNLVSFANNVFTVYDTTDGLPDRFITCIAFDTNGVMWCGSRYHGISVYDGKQWKNFNTYNSVIPDPYIKSVYIDWKNRVWACTGKGLAVYVNEQWDVFNMGNSTLPDNNVNSVACAKYPDEEPEINIATDKGILFYSEYSDLKTKDNPPVILTKNNSLLPDDQINQVLIGQYGEVWISSWDGIVKTDKGPWKLYTPDNSKIPRFAEYVLSVYKDELWVATNMGLYILQNENWSVYTPANSEIPDYFINKVVFDREGYAWIATQSGLVKFSRE